MTFAADCLKAVGMKKDVLKAFRGKYKNARQAKEILKQRRGGIKDLALELFQEFPQINHHSVKRGDVALVKYGKAKMMGICIGPKIAVLAERGIEFVEFSYIDVAWGIGHR